MIIVHDDDLAQISGICDTSVSRHHIFVPSWRSCPDSIVGRSPPPPTRCGETLPPNGQRGSTHIIIRQALTSITTSLILTLGTDLLPAENGDPRMIRVARLEGASHGELEQGGFCVLRP